MPAFDQLISPLNRSDFNDRCWLTESCTLSPDPKLIEPLLADARLADLEQLAAAGHDSYRIARSKNNPVEDVDRSAALNAWESEPEVTVVATESQRTLDTVRDYCLSIAGDIGVPLRILWPNVYFSRPGSGFSRHWDNHENFIVGITGSKTFVVAPNGLLEYPESNAASFGKPIRGYEQEVESERLAAELPGMFSVDIGPGDCVFIPRGWWHEAIGGDSGSTTLTLALWTCTWGDLLQVGRITAPESVTELTLRTPVGLDALSVPDELGLDDDARRELIMVRAKRELRLLGYLYKNWRTEKGEVDGR